jgi:hypothetical protein
MKHVPLRPGLAKTRGLPLVETREMVLVRTHDGPIRLLFEHADAVSEGAESHGMWRGTTSIVLRAQQVLAAPLAAIAAQCIHVRLRALRFARREAQARASGELGQARCDLRVLPHADGILVEIDVEAPILRKGVGHGG